MEMRGIYILGLALPRSPTYVTALIQKNKCYTNMDNKGYLSTW